MRIEAQRNQKLGRLVDREIAAFRREANKRTRDAARELKESARDLVRRAFSGGRFSRGGRRAAGAVRSVDREGAGGFVRATVFSRLGRREGGDFVDYLLPHTEGLTLTAKRSRWLYIPLQRGRRARNVRRVLALERNVKVVPTRVAGRFLVIRETRTRSTPIAILVRRVRFEKKLDFDRPAEKAAADLLRDLARGEGGGA